MNTLIVAGVAGLLGGFFGALTRNIYTRRTTKPKEKS